MTRTRDGQRDRDDLRSSRCARFAVLLVGLGGLAACSPGPNDGGGPSQKPSVDLAIITVIPEEYRAVVRKLDRVTHDSGSSASPNRFAWGVGEIASPRHRTPYRVVVALAGEAGMVSGALATQRTIAAWNPRHVLVVGVAGGVAENVARGDVVISTAVWGYEYGSLDDRFVPRHDFTYRPDGDLLRSATTLEADWQQSIEVEPPVPTRPKAVAGQVGSGNKVIETRASDFYRQVIEANPGIVAVEMEGAGAAAAAEEARSAGATVGFLMIRGISDIPQRAATRGGPGRLMDKPDREQWKDYAADASASFAVSLVRHNWPIPPRAVP
jgi:nucleoside phosphorylase